uniref:HAT C-terminal dimerisation domain-containing protein n=1 Tax=Pelodiscus sinensis TaxID=13735 RepID=K7GAS4_PELSI
KKEVHEDYIKYGFTIMGKNGIDHLQFVVCHTVLSNDTLKPSCLEQHLAKNHNALIDFAAKLQNLKHMKLDTTGTFHQALAKVVEASYELSLLIAKAKKAHIIGEILVKPCLLKAADTMLGVESKKKHSSVKCHIDELAKELKLQVVLTVLASPFFAIQCDDTTDVAQCCQLFVCVQFLNSGTVKELLFLKELMTTSKASITFLKKIEFHGEKLVDVCTDGAPAILDTCSEFVMLVKEKNPAVTTTHWVIHRQALATKTLPDDLRDSLNLAIQVVSFVKNSALNTRLFYALCTDLGADYKTLLFHILSKGNMLSRLFELKDNRRKELYHAFMDQTFQLSLTYLMDIFESLNNLSLKLQGNNTTNIIAHHDAIKAFTEKIQLWKHQTQAQMPNLTFSSLAENEDFQEVCKEDVKNKIVFRLDCLADEFICYFPNNFSGNPIHKLRNPFNVDVDSLPEVLQEQALKIKYDSSAKDNFENASLEEFRIKYFPMYSKVGEEALRIILSFSSTYLCEKSFSSLVILKTKQRNRLDVENDLHCTLASFKPRISQLI